MLANESCFTEELQLSLPPACVSALLPLLGPVLTGVMQLGCSLLSLAETGLAGDGGPQNEGGGERRAAPGRAQSGPPVVSRPSPGYCCREAKLQERAAQLFREFLQWRVKQGGVANTKSVLWRHLDPCRRLGSCGSTVPTGCCGRRRSW